MVAKSKHIYRVQDNQLQFILNSISDRLDKLEGIRANLNIDGDLSVSGTITGDMVISAVQRREAYETNSGNVTVTGALTTILTLDCGSCSDGDRILLVGTAQFEKGATGGRSRLRIDESTANTVGFFDSWFAGFLPGSDFTQDANDTNRLTVFGIAEVGKSTQISILMRGISDGSNSTVSTGQAVVHAWVFRNS